MANVSVDLDFTEVLKKADIKFNAGMAAATLEAQKYITEQISVGQDKKIYPSGRQVGLNPSKPGEYPKVVTSLLKKSIHTKTIKGFSLITGRVFTNMEYAPYLEYGGRSFMRRGVKENLGNIGKAFMKGAGS